jgi:hypothetical protein
MQQHLYVAEKLMELDAMPRHVMPRGARHGAHTLMRRPAALVARFVRRAGDAIESSVWPRGSKTVGDDCGC